MEAVAIGIIGLGLGLVLGAVQLYYSVEVARRDLIGVGNWLRFPLQMVFIMMPIILGAACRCFGTGGERGQRIFSRG